MSRLHAIIIRNRVILIPMYTILQVQISMETLEKIYFHKYLQMYDADRYLQQLI